MNKGLDKAFNVYPARNVIDILNAQPLLGKNPSELIFMSPDNSAMSAMSEMGSILDSFWGQIFIFSMSIN